jgi:[ribosomal protein S18]-alanine N-acetyltransferase
VTAPALLSPGGAADLDAVMDIMEDSFDPSFGEGWTAPQCSGLLPMPGVWLTIARNGKTTSGFALSRIVLDEAELLLLAVKKQWQGRGIGQLLLDSFIAEATRRGARRLHLEVRQGNHAVNLYKRAGFSEIGRRKAYYSGRDGQTYDALTLARPI